MQVAMRRVIVISAISIGGAAVGIALGNFAASGQKRTGMEELAAYNQMFGTANEAAATADLPDPGFASRTGPTSYECEGCDAQLYNDVVGGDVTAADTTPLPAYQPEETPVTVVRPPAAATPPPRQPAALVAVPFSPPRPAEGPPVTASLPAN